MSAPRRSRGGATIQETLNIGGKPGESLLDVAARTNPGLRERLQRERTPSPEPEVLSRIMLADYGDRARTGGINLRLGEAIRRRLDAACEAYPMLEKTRLVEVGLDRLLSELGF
jgi:hypothetical protein